MAACWRPDELEETRLRGGLQSVDGFSGGVGGGRRVRVRGAGLVPERIHLFEVRLCRRAARLGEPALDDGGNARGSATVWLARARDRCAACAQVDRREERSPISRAVACSGPGSAADLRFLVTFAIRAGEVGPVETHRGILPATGTRPRAPGRPLGCSRPAGEARRAAAYCFSAFLISCHCLAGLLAVLDLRPAVGVRVAPDKADRTLSSATCARADAAALTEQLEAAKEDLRKPRVAEFLPACSARPGAIASGNRRPPR